MSQFIPPGTTQAFDDDENQHEIDLYDTTEEQHDLEDLSDLYAIIMTTESLERAYARSAVSRDEYVQECSKLISQFKIAEKTARAQKMTTETFMNLYQMDCPKASHRLLVAGVPETMTNAENSDKHVITVQETTEHFIGIMDALKLNVMEVDALQPLLSDLLNSLTRLPDTPNDFEPNRIAQQWLQKLNLMRAVDNIDEADARQLFMELDGAYNVFKEFLKNNR